MGIPLSKKLFYRYWLV